MVDQQIELRTVRAGRDVEWSCGRSHLPVSDHKTDDVINRLVSVFIQH